MTILLDIDGVLVTTPGWRPVELDTDGFIKFNERAARNLSKILEETKAEIVLTTTHRIHYSVDRWKEIFQKRGINTTCISLINETTTLSKISDRATEIKEWLEKQSENLKFVVIDDDLSINSLPNFIKARCVLTKPLIGLDNEMMRKVLSILQV